MADHHIHHANTRSDVAGNGFDDAHVYDEVGRAALPSSIRMSRLLGPESAAVFREWQAKADKVTY